jgi:hypothetical protein
MKKDFLTAQERLTLYGHWYKTGVIDPHYPVPATTLNALIAVPYENIMPLVKAWLLEDKS